MRLLLVEDDTMIGRGVEQGLTRLGFALDWVTDGSAAEAALTARPYAMLLLDLGLPGTTGMQLLASLRRAGDDIPVLVLTARDGVNDRIAGLDAGADDYLVKPFDLGELAARIRALARRRDGYREPLLVNGDLSLDPASHEVRYRGVMHAFSTREFTLLRVLMERPGRILSVRQIEEQLYSGEINVESNAVEVCIHHIRRKLDPDVIVNVRGVGYMVPKGS